MSQRALAVSTALQAEMPELTVRLAQSGDAIGKIDLSDGPVITVEDGIASGFHIKLYTDDVDDVSGLAADIFRATKNRAFALDETGGELFLAFERMEPLLDDSDYLVGERLRYTTIERFSAASIESAAA